MLCFLYMYVGFVVPQVRPGTENEEDVEERIQTVAFSDVSPAGSSPGVREKTKGAEADPEASLITDFQIITDIRVSSACVCVCVCVCVWRSGAGRRGGGGRWEIRV